MPCRMVELNTCSQAPASQPMPPAQRETQQHHGLDQRIQHGQAGLGAGVIGGLLVCGQVDLAAECGGHLGAVRRDVGQVAARQPQLGERGKQQGGNEQAGKQGCSHRFRIVFYAKWKLAILEWPEIFDWQSGMPI